jgi:hypothetical protein
LLQFVEHVLGELLSVVLTDPTVLGSGEETSEVKRLLTDLSYGEVRTFQNSLKTLKQSLGFVATFRDVVLKGGQLLGRDLILLFGGQLRLEVAAGFIFVLAESLGDFFVAAFIFLGFAEKVRLEKLVFSLDLLIVLLHSFKTLHKLFNGETLQIDVWRVEVVSMLVHFYEI